MKKRMHEIVKRDLKIEREVWDRDLGNNHHLHAIFPRDGPQKQGNRLAGLLRTKGEHQPFRKFFLTRKDN